MKFETKILVVLILAVLSSCQTLESGKNKLIEEYYNPKQNLKVIVFEKLGNATVNNSIQASIHGQSFKLTNKEVGNIFVADQIEAIKTSKDSLLNVIWGDNKTVEIIYPTNIRTFKMEKLFKDKTGRVKIDYKTKNE